MRRNRILAVVAVLIALGLAAGTAATTAPIGSILAFVALTTQANHPGVTTNAATKVTVLNLNTQTCSYTVRFLDKWGVQQCQLTKSLAPNQEANFSTNDVPDDVYKSYPNCPGLDDYKGSAEIFVPNTPGCRQKTVVDSYAVTWEPTDGGGDPASSRRLTIISMDKYSGKIQEGD